MYKLKPVFLLVCALAIYLSNAIAQPLSRISIDFRGGMPSILTSTANQSAAPYAGLGVRYSFNSFLSLSVDANGGVIAGRTSNGFFRNNFIQYGGKVHFNPMAFVKNRPDFLKRFNTYLSFGMNNMNYYYTLQQTSIENKLSRTFFMYDAGLTIRYYANEMVDFIGGTNFNFTQTSSIDNFNNGKYDHFALTYLGLSVKILPYERKQSPDWSHVELPYNTGTMALTKQLVGDLEKDVTAQNKQNTDSIAALRAEIKTVDQKVVTVNTKVDSVDAKLNMVLELLTKMQTQGVNVNQTTTISTPQQGTTTTKGKNTVKKGGKTTGKPSPTTVTTTTIIEEPGNRGAVDTIVSTTVIPGNTNTNSATGTKPAILEQSKVKENYAIVVGSFQMDENAMKARDRYITKGWDAHILGNGRSPYKRIVIFSNNYFEAAKIVTELRNTESPDVWMLDISTGKGVFIK